MSKCNESSLIMFCYGFLFGYIKLIKDTHHDEVFIEQNGLVVMENGIQRHSNSELLEIARQELNYGKVTIIDYGDTDG